MKRIFPLSLLLVLPWAMAQEMNRCNVAGKIVIQETPCAAAQRTPAQLQADVAAARRANEKSRNLDQILAEGRPLVIPPDASATWLVLEKTGAPGDELHTITTRRIGRSGTTWSKREYDCLRSTVRYLGTGNSLDAMRASKPDPALAPIVSNSIADHLGREACRNYDVAPFAVGGKGNS